MSTTKPRVVTRRPAGRGGGKLRFTPVQILAHLLAWALLAWLAWDYFTNNLGVNPIQDLTRRTGKYALVLLLLSLAATPLNAVFGWRQVLTVRRPLGLYAFMFAAIHLSIFIGLDYVFDWELILIELREKRFVLVGLGALLILLALAVTSFRWWMKRLGKNWKRLHRLVYLAGGLVIVHYFWASKGDVTRLQGDIWQPLLFGLLLVILLGLRIPAVRLALGKRGGSRPVAKAGPGRGPVSGRGHSPGQSES